MMYRSPRLQPQVLWFGLNCASVVAILVLLVWAGSGVGVQSQNVLISEFLAANSSGQRDEDGDYNDWIEIYNADSREASLAGWFLSGSPGNLTQWRFPDVLIPGHGFLVVFASGKNRTDPKGALHTNFKLAREGEYLALVRPDGRSAASQYAPAFPRQLTDVSYGKAMVAEMERLVPFEATAHLFVPEDDQLGQTWLQPDFADGNWTIATTGIGYDRPSGGDTEPPEPAGPLEDVTRPGDPIVGTSSNSPGGEEVDKAIDDNSRTKYLNFDKLNAGFTVTPSAAETVVTGLRLTSANDAPDRDPTTYLLLGSMDGQAFTEIARGSIPDFPSRFFTVEVAFTNTVAYLQYRLLFPTVRNAAAAVAMQIAEVEFLGRVGPPPPNLAELIQTSVEAPMFGRNSSIYVRLPFSVPEIRPREGLAMRVRYDDGFVAYLNGVEVARANAPANLSYNSAALTNRTRTTAVQEQRFSLSPYAQVIRQGANVLAIQGLNDRADSPDFLLQAQLENVTVTLGEDSYFASPSPGRENGPGQRGLIGDLVVEPKRGFYEAPIDVLLSSPTEGATIRFTTDGSTPSATNGQVYLSPIRVNRTTTLRAIAIGEGWHPSRVSTHTYLFLNDVAAQTRTSTMAAGFPATWNAQAADYGLDPRVVGPDGQDNFAGKYTRTFKTDLQAVPTMSIVMDIDDWFGPQGIYSNPLNQGDAWERAASMEIIYPDNREGFQANAGIRIQGGAFRRFDLALKKSFRVVFRDKYGDAKLAYPLFGPEAASEFDNFVLRANSNDAWAYWGGSALYVRDAFAMETARAMGIAASHTLFVHLYLNGMYWGLYNPVERPDAAFSAAYHGGDKDSWDAINQDSVTSGSYEAWNRLLAQLNMGMASTEAFQRVQGNNPDGTRNPDYENLLDVENMIDYLILNFYVGNTDWPGRNWWVGRNRDQGDGFQFYPWDTETALGPTGLDVDRTGVADAVARPYAAVRANAGFRLQFADRVYRHFFNGGALYVNPASPSWDPTRPENNQPAARLAALGDQVSSALVGESARWGDQLNRGLYTRDEHWLRERDNILTNYLPRRSAIVLEQFRRAGLYPRIDPPTMNVRGGQVEPGFLLTLNAPQGTIYYTTNGTDPHVPVSVQEISRKTLVSRAAVKKAFVPSVANGGSQLGAAWQGGQEPFTESSWISGTGGVGYDLETTYRSHIQLDVQGDMASKNASVFIRIPFTYDGAGRDRLNFLSLRVQYDDGFVAFLNGRQIASANAPATLQWNSTATGANGDTAAVVFEEFQADEALSALKVGVNVLAIQGLNVSTSSSDFLIGAELIAGERHVSSGAIQAVQYTEPITLTDLSTIKARAFNGTEWSALQEATFVVGTPALTVTEIHYHPGQPTEAERLAGFIDAEDFEFIELYNDGTGTIDLTGFRFITGIRFDFTGAAITRLAPGQYLLVVRNQAAFDRRYGPDWAVAGEYSGRLDNAGERVELVNAQNEIVLSFVYGTDAPWPKAADGAGASLELTDPAGDLNAPGNWQASATSGGSPGQPNWTAPLQVEASVTQAGQLQFHFPGRAGLGYTIYARESLSSGVWEVLATGEPLVQDQAVQVAVDVAPDVTARFFRVSVP